MPRVAKIKVGDRVQLKNTDDLFGVVVYKQPNLELDVHWDIEYNKRNLKEVRRSRGRYHPSQLAKVKPNVATTEEEDA